MFRAERWTMSYSGQQPLSKGRKASRKHTFFVIYQIPFHDTFDMGDALETYFSEYCNADTADWAYIERAAHGTFEQLERIDALITEYAVGWRFERLAKVDLALLRLSLYELLHMQDIPTSVSINEAVELCKIYGDNDAHAFVNGLLGNAAVAIRGEKV